MNATKARALRIERQFVAYLESGQPVTDADQFAYMELTQHIRQFERGDIEEPTLAALCDRLEQV